MSEHVTLAVLVYGFLCKSADVVGLVFLQKPTWFVFTKRDQQLINGGLRPLEEKKNKHPEPAVVQVQV